VIVYGEKMKYPHYDPNPLYIWKNEMQYMHNHLKMHIICGWQNVILALNPHYLWEAKMLNPYIKHGTFLVKFYDRIKTIQGD
jgi:hypothetical protein